jgi:cytochrome P450 family 6
MHWLKNIVKSNTIDTYFMIFFLGMRFAKMQSKVGLYAISRNFEILESSKTIYPPVWDPKQFLLTSKDDIYIKFQAIDK